MRTVKRDDSQLPMYYSVADIMAITGMARASIYNLMNEGKLKAVKVGKRTLISYASLQEWLASLAEYKPAGSRPYQRKSQQPAKVAA